ncbi:MAG: histidinol dehydrogenase [Anaerolineae bacterium]|nr:histidinol dehydrogenase [Anaerolineae bacterium]
MTSVPAPFRVITDVEAARASILRRAPLPEAQLPEAVLQRLAALFGAPVSAQEAVDRIIAEVRRRGDDALRDYSRTIDGVLLDDLAVPPSELRAALTEIPAALRLALEVAAERVRAFHQRQPRHSWLHWQEEGALGQMVLPLERVGVYVPGGTAPLASSLIMAAVPAQVAGVDEIAVCTPPQPQTGLPHPVVMAAAAVLGLERVYRVGGAQAIAAMALGTESIPRVDKVVGPGNVFVVLAKKALYGSVGIESLPGPTETLIIADDSADPAAVAADMLAQAEHTMATALVLTTSSELIEALAREVNARLSHACDSLAVESLANRGGVVLCRSLSEAMALANEYAPEHLCLLVRDPWSLLPRVRHAGGVFLGHLSSEALGDYVAGPSHIMPTGGTARFASPLNVWDFVKITSIFAIGATEAAQIGPAGAILAEAEGLTFHRDAIMLRGGESTD